MYTQLNTPGATQINEHILNSNKIALHPNLNVFPAAIISGNIPFGCTCLSGLSPEFAILNSEVATKFPDGMVTKIKTANIMV